MEVTIDKYGRIVIPKPVRDRLGLEAGTSLAVNVESSDEGEVETITLQPANQEPVLQRKGSILVHTGRLTDETYDIVEDLWEQRKERSQRLAGL